MTLNCSRCIAAGETISERHQSPRGCGFNEKGDFTYDNYRCATLQALNGLLCNDEKIPSTKLFDQDEWVLTTGLSNFPDVVIGEGSVSPIALVLHQYKSRGRISGAWIVLDGGFTPIPLSIEMTEEILKEHGI